MKDKIENIKKTYSENIRLATTLDQLDKIYLALFGKTGELTLLPKEFPLLSKETLREVAPLFNALKNKKHKAMLFTAYSAGLRVSEILNLHRAVGGQFVVPLGLGVG
jgi:integrase